MERRINYKKLSVIFLVAGVILREIGEVGNLNYFIKQVVPKLVWRPLRRIAYTLGLIALLFFGCFVTLIVIAVQGA